MPDPTRPPRSHRLAALAARLGPLGEVRRSWRLLRDASPRWLAAAGVLTLANGLLPLAALVVLRRTVDAVAAGDESAALAWVAALAATGVAAACCLSLASLADETLAAAVSARVADETHARSVELDLEYYDRPSFYALLHQAQREGAYRPARVVRGTVRLGQSAITLAAMGGVLFASTGWSALLLAAAVVPGAVFRATSARRLRGWQREHAEDERRAAHLRELMTGAEAAKEVRAFDLGPEFRGQHLALADRLAAGRYRLALRRVRGELLAQLPLAAAVGVVLATAARSATGGRMSPGEFLVVVLAVRQGLAVLVDAAAAAAGLYEDGLFLAAYSDFLKLRPAIADPPGALPAPARPASGFEFENVAFRYPDSERPVLDGVSLAVRPGQVVALVGVNGAGKTTVVKLLCRMYDPSAGRVLLDGVPLPRYELAGVRRLVGVVFQDPTRYALTLRENVLLGAADRPADPAAVKAALDLAGVTSFLGRLPHGADTLLGRWRRGGTELSGGQWQRVAVARGLYRDSALLILDEPTSSMDAEAEDRFLESLRRDRSGRSVLLISHRFTAIRRADYIYVLDGGRVVQEGTHDTLVNQAGEYSRLHELQMKSPESYLSDEQVRL